MKMKKEILVLMLALFVFVSASPSALAQEESSATLEEALDFLKGMADSTHRR